jgi:myo-inositol-1-phosphate synthase
VLWLEIESCRDSISSHKFFAAALLEAGLNFVNPSRSFLPQSKPTKVFAPLFTKSGRFLALR